MVIYTPIDKTSQQSVTQNTWPILRKTGSSPRFWTFIAESGILENQLWLTLNDPLDEQWLNEVIIKLLDFPSIDIQVESTTLLNIVRGWMSGLTYAELSIICAHDVERVLEFVCNDVGYHMQDHVAKLCQLAIDRYGEEAISEIARNWATLLQYGLGNMQQLDIFLQGGSDRLATWGISRFLEANDVHLRGNKLINNIRTNRKTIRTAMAHDERVPKLSANRICRELRI